MYKIFILTHKTILFFSCIILSILGSLQLFGNDNTLETESRNLLGNSSFETGHGCFKLTWRGVTANIDTNDAFEGTRSLCWKSPVKNDWLISPRIETKAGKIYTFSLYAKASRNNVKAKLMFVKSDWGDTTTKNITLNKDWKRYSFTLKAKHKGGTNRGNSDSYWLGVGAIDNATIWIDACQFEEGNKPTTYKSREPISVGLCILSENWQVFFPNEKIEIQYFVDKPQETLTTQGMTISFSVKNSYGELIKRTSIPLRMNGRKLQKLFLMPKIGNSSKLGLYTVKVELKDSAGLISQAMSTFAIVNPPVKIEKNLKPFCGLIGPGNPSGLERIGSRWYQVLVKWNQIETIKGQYNWSELERLKELKEKGFKTRLVIGHFPSAPQWTWDPKEVADSKKRNIPVSQFGFLPMKKYFADWQNFFHLLATKYDKYIDIYEIGGEDDLTLGLHPYYRQKYPEAVKNGFVTGPATDCEAEMIKIAVKEIKFVNPKAEIGAIRPSGVDCNGGFPFSTAVFKKAGKDFNIFPIDCYPPNHYIGTDKGVCSIPEEFLPSVFTNALSLGKTLGIKQHVYPAEFGYGLDINEEPDGYYARELLKLMVRSYLISRATKGVDTCHWYRSIGCREAEKYEYGLWRDDYPLLGVPAYSMVANTVENVREVKEIKLPGKFKVVIFGKSDSACAALWLSRGKGKITLPLPLSVKILDVFGNSVMKAQSSSDTTLEITETPIYLQISGVDGFEKLKHSFNKAKPHFFPLDVSFNMHSIDQGVLTLQNIHKRSVSISVSIVCGKNNILYKNVNVLPNRTKKIEVSLAKNSINRKQKLEINIKENFSRFNSKWNAAFFLDFTPCKKITEPIHIDGDLSEWSSSPCIVFNKRGQIQPPDPQITWHGIEDLSAKVYMGWDENYIYLGIKVKDDLHFNTKSGPDIWNGDAIQFAFAPHGGINGGTGKNNYGPNDYELGLALVRKVPSAAKWFGSYSKLWKEGDFAIVRNEKNKETIYEAKIPISRLEISPVPGRIFGFNIVIFDDDEGAGQSYYYQNSPGITGGKHPNMFNKFFLSK